MFLSMSPKNINGFPSRIREVITSLIPISSFKWWFMTYYVLVMFISPIINKGFESESKKMVSIILLTLIIYQLLSFVRLIPNGGSNFLGLLTVYLIGRYCNVYKHDINTNKAILIGMLKQLIKDNSSSGGEGGSGAGDIIYDGGMET